MKSTLVPTTLLLWMAMASSLPGNAFTATRVEPAGDHRRILPDAGMANKFREPGSLESLLQPSTEPRPKLRQPLAVSSTPVIPGVFEQMDTDDGGWFTGFAIHSTGRLYGRTDVGGLYRSDDHGESWIYLSGDMTSYTAHCVQGVAIAASDSNIVYQCVGFAYGNTDQGIWKSTDGGTTWIQVKSGIRFSGNDPERWGGECIAIRDGVDSEIWAGSRGDGLWRSTNAGASWVQIATPTFAGAQFTSMALPPPGRSDIWVGAAGFEGPGGVWVSINEGASWTKISGMQAAVPAPEGCWRIARQPNGNVLVAGGNGTQGSVLYEFSAADWGNPLTYSWNDISWPGMDRSQAIPLITALADGRLISGSIFGGYTGGPASIRTQIRSLAGSWSPIDTLNGAMPAWQRSPPPTLIEGGRNALIQDPTQPDRWFMAGGYGPFRTTNAGASWQYIVNGIDEIVAYKVSFHPTQTNRFYVPMADHGGAVILDDGSGAAVSRYITTRALPYPDDLGLCHAMLASGDRILALGADERDDWRARIYRSMNNGVTWSVLTTSGLPPTGNRCIISAVSSRLAPDDIVVALAGMNGAAEGGVYRSTNGAVTFVRSTGLPTGVDFGDQWNPNADLEVDASEPNIRYLFLKNRGLYKSTNSGSHWSFVNTGLPDYGIMASDYSIGGSLWVGTCCGQPIGLAHSTNGGDSWVPITGFTDITDVDAANDRVAVLGQRTGDAYNKIYYSGDGGVTWGEVTRPGQRFGNAVAVAVDPWRPGAVWISSNGRSVARFKPGALTALQQWRQDHFGTAEDAGEAANTADPDGDSISNLVEFAFDLDPKFGNSRNDLPRGKLDGGDLTVEFLQPANLGGITYRAEKTDSLSAPNWSVIPDSGVAPQHSFRLPIPAPGSAFIRLTITVP